MRSGFFGALAANFNALLMIGPGHFGASPRKEPGASPRKEPGAGVLRARERLEKHRAAQRERLKDAPPPKVTRQQVRSYMIRGR